MNLSLVCVSLVCMSLVCMQTPTAVTWVLCVLASLLVLHVPLCHRVQAATTLCVCVFALCLLHRTMCVQCCTCPRICRIILIHKMKLTAKTTLRAVGGPGP